MRPWASGSEDSAVHEPSQAGPRTRTDRPTDWGETATDGAGRIGYADRPSGESRAPTLSFAEW